MARHRVRALLLYRDLFLLHHELTSFASTPPLACPRLPQLTPKPSPTSILPVDHLRMAFRRVELSERKFPRPSRQCPFAQTDKGAIPSPWPSQTLPTSYIPRASPFATLYCITSHGLVPHMIRPGVPAP